MSSDLYSFTVEYLGPPSGRVHDLPWFPKAVKRFGKLMGLDLKRPVPEIAAEIQQIIEAAGEEGAAQAIPVDKLTSQEENNRMRAALLHRAFPDKFEPRSALAIFDVVALQDRLPGKYSDRVLVLRWLYDLRDDHPVRAMVERQKLYEEGYGSGSPEFKVAMMGRSRKRELMAVLAPPEWFEGMEVGQNFGTTAWA